MATAHAASQGAMAVIGGAGGDGRLGGSGGGVGGGQYRASQGINP